MRTKIVQGSEEHQLFIDFWNFRQNFHDGEDGEEFWETMVKEADKIIKKYENTPYSKFAQRLIFACLEDSEIRWREGKNNGKG